MTERPILYAPGSKAHVRSLIWQRIFPEDGDFLPAGNDLLPVGHYCLDPMCDWTLVVDDAKAAAVDIGEYVIAGRLWFTDVDSDSAVVELGGTCYVLDSQYKFAPTSSTPKSAEDWRTLGVRRTGRK